MEVWKVGKTFLIHRSSSMLWEMIVSNVMCMKIEYIRLKYAKWCFSEFVKPTGTFSSSSITFAEFLLVVFVLFVQLH
ncbi:hypothetical protein LDENG_00171370 [Lucifuga dentata]|nr:hypothetical protein LDENG_00171370 [Lucifuga dentata]